MLCITDKRICIVESSDPSDLQSFELVKDDEFTDRLYLLATDADGTRLFFKLDKSDMLVLKTLLDKGIKYIEGNK